MKLQLSDNDRFIVLFTTLCAEKLVKNWQFVGLAMLVVAFTNPSIETAANHLYKSAKNNMTGRSLCTQADLKGDAKCYYTVDKLLLNESQTASVFKNATRRNNLIFASIFQYSSTEIRSNLISEAKNTIQIASDYSLYESSQRSRNPQDFCSGINCPNINDGTRIDYPSNDSALLAVGALGLVFSGKVRLD